MMMAVNKRGGYAVILIILCFVSISVLTTYGDVEGEVGQNKEQEQEHGNGKWTGALSKILGSGVFPFSSISHVPTAAAPSFWDKFKAMLNQVYPRSLHPNLDFRGSEEPIGSGEGSRAGAGEKVKEAGEKVKEAVERSVEKSKEAVEDSAKSAAQMATEAVHKTTEGVKKSLSAKKDTDSQGEL